MTRPAGWSVLCALVAVDDTEAHDPHAAVACARALCDRQGGRVVALLTGRSPDERALAAARDAGADDVWRVSREGPEAPVQTDALLDAFSQAIEAAGLTASARDTLFLVPAGSVGEELAARLAVRLDGVALGRCVEIERTADGIRCVRPAYGGRARALLVAPAGPWFVAVRRPGANEAIARPACAPGRSEALVLDPAPAAPGSVRYSAAAQGRRPLEGAAVVVAGGRGIGSPEGFALLAQLADRLGAALGGSLPAVDAGWVPVSHQIGQSGKYVTPGLYLAVGVSGTSQHMAGIGAGVRIVAINEDPDADIFRVAELGLVADWRAVLPALVERLG